MEILGEIQKNQQEIVRISVVEYHGRKQVDVRTCWEHEGRYLFTRKGVTVRPENLDTVIDLLKEARNKLKAAT